MKSLSALEVCIKFWIVRRNFYKRTSFLYEKALSVIILVGEYYNCNVVFVSIIVVSRLVSIEMAEANIATCGDLMKLTSRYLRRNVEPMTAKSL